MTTQVIDYDITQAGLAELRSRLLIKFDANTKDGYEHARKGIAECRSLRVAVEKKRKELKADALEYGRKVDAVAKELTASLEQIEKPLQDAKDAVDAERDRVKREAEEKARMEREAKEQAEREAREAELRAERERLAKERAEFERQQAEQRAQIEAEQRRISEAARIEREKLEAERRAIEAQQRAAQIEQAKREAAERAAREERERIERERLAADEAERNRQEAEAKRLAERPDWIKAKEWAESVAVTAATWAGIGIESQDARDATANAWAEIHDVVETLIAFAKSKA